MDSSPGAPPESVNRTVGGGEDAIDTLPTVPTRPGVLVVHHEARIRALLKVTLRDHGFAVFQADSGAEALELYPRHRDETHLVLLDVDLPDRDGPAMLRGLRELNPDVRCCFLTSAPGPYPHAELLDLGALRLFSKTFEPSALVRDLWPLVLGPNGSTTPPAEVPGDAVTPPPERRAVPRFRATRESSCRTGAEPDSGAWSCRLADVSVEGARLVLDHQLEVGALLSLGLPATASLGPWTLLARVVRVDRAPEGRWSLACTFTNRLTEPQLRALVD